MVQQDGIPIEIKWNIHALLTMYWVIPEKNQTGGVENILFWKPSSENFRFVISPLEIPEKTSFHPWKFTKIVWHPLEIPRSKTKTHRNSTWVFPWTPLEILLLFSLTPGISIFSFFSTPGNYMSSTPPVCFFSGIVHFKF